MESERKAVLELANTIKIQLMDDDIVRLHRLGKYARERDRPLKVCFKQTNTVESVLRNAKGLKHAPEPFKEVQINRDLTQMQRDEESELEQECKKRNQNLTSDEAKNFKWRVVGRKGSKRLIKVSIDSTTNLQDEETSEQPDQNKRQRRELQNPMDTN